MKSSLSGPVDPKGGDVYKISPIDPKITFYRCSKEAKG